MSRQVCKNCGVSIGHINYAMGPRWMHNPPGRDSHKMGGGAYNVYEYCEGAVATPIEDES